MKNNFGLEPADGNNVIITIENKFSKTGSPTKIPLLRGRRSFSAELSGQGISVDNLGNQPFLPWKVFQETIRILVENDGRACISFIMLIFPGQLIIICTLFHSM